MRFLLSFEFLVKLTQAWSSVVVGVGSDGRSGEYLRARGRQAGLVAGHLARRRDRWVVELQIQKNG
jgi:hypothetical protein